MIVAIDGYPRRCLHRFVAVDRALRRALASLS